MSEVDSNDYWENFIKSIGKIGDTDFSCVFLVPFKESLRCFNAEAYLAACAMCRASVEALLHTVGLISGFEIGLKKEMQPFEEQILGYDCILRRKYWADSVSLAKICYAMQRHVRAVKPVVNVFIATYKG